MNETRQIVVPGDVVGSADEHMPGQNTYQEGRDIKALRLGVKSVRGDRVNVIGLSGRYEPARGDMVIGTIAELGPSNWYINIGAANDVGMHVNDVPWRVEFGETSKYLAIGDTVLLKIVHVDEMKKAQVTMKDRQCRKLTGGLIWDVSPTKVPRIVGRNGSMIQLIKDATSVRIFVGQNGKVWIDGEPADVSLALEALNKIEVEAHTTGLTDRMKAWLEERRPSASRPQRVAEEEPDGAEPEQEFRPRERRPRPKVVRDDEEGEGEERPPRGERRFGDERRGGREERGGHGGERRGGHERRDERPARRFEEERGPRRDRDEPRGRAEGDERPRRDERRDERPARRFEEPRARGESDERPRRDERPARRFEDERGPRRERDEAPRGRVEGDERRGRDERPARRFADEEREARPPTRRFDDDVAERPARRPLRDEEPPRRMREERGREEPRGRGEAPPMRREPREAPRDERPARRMRDEDEEEDRPVRRLPREEPRGRAEERPARRPRDDDEEPERPARRFRDNDEDDDRPARAERRSGGHESHHSARRAGRGRGRKED